MKHSGGLLALSLAAVVLCGVIAAECVPGAVDAPTGPITGQQDPTASRVPAAAGTLREDRTPGQVGSILARPLFSPSRLPDPIGAAVSASGLPRLSGVSVTPTGKVAIFASGADGKPLVAGEGGRVGGYTVEAIEAGAVTIIGHDGRQTLRPTFDPNPPARLASPGLIGGTPLRPAVASSAH